MELNTPCSNCKNVMHVNPFQLQLYYTMQKSFVFTYQRDPSLIRWSVLYDMLPA